jgi:hypothetical protein
MRLADAEAEKTADCPGWSHSRWSEIGVDGTRQQSYHVGSECCASIFILEKLFSF